VNDLENRLARIERKADHANFMITVMLIFGVATSGLQVFAELHHVKRRIEVKVEVPEQGKAEVK